MTAVVTRPARPRNSLGLIVPLLVLVAGAGFGALLIPLPGGSFLWAAATAAGLIAALWLAKVEIQNWEMALVAGGTFLSVVLTSLLLNPVPDLITPSFVAGVGAVWLVAGAGSAVVVYRRRGIGAALNIGLVWAGAAVIAIPLAATVGALEPGADELTAGAAAAISVAVMALGGAATLYGVTGVVGIAVGASVILLTWFAALKVGLTIGGLVENISNIANFPEFWPPDFQWAIGEGTWWWLPSWDFGNPNLPSPLVETFQIAIIASVIGCLAALPVSFLASTVTAPGRISYLLDKSFMNVIRTIPDLFWALLFVAGLGIGPLPGIFALFFFSLSIMAKLLSETIDAVDPGPLEAARATGGSHFPAVRMSVFPQVLPNYVAYALYIFELNIRASTVLGIVGAGGIGRVLEAQRKFFQFDRVMAVVLIIFVIVFTIEQISVALRRRLV